MGEWERVGEESRRREQEKKGCEWKMRMGYGLQAERYF